MVRKKRDTAEKRQSILTAAAAEFVRVGYDRASMDGIAEAATASKRTVYNHFASKEQLFHAVLEQFMSDSQALKRVPYQADVDLRAQLNRFAEAMLEPTRNPVWLGLMKVISTSPATVGHVLAKLDQEEDSLVAWLRAAAQDGRLAVVDPELAAGAFWAMLSGAFLMPAIFAEPLPAAAAEAMKRELVEMFLARYGEP